MIIQDKEFGEVVIRRSAWAKVAKFSISATGRLTVSVPARTSDMAVKRFLNHHRAFIRERVPLKDPAQQRARDYRLKIINKKAKAYLPERLAYYARLYHYEYDKCRMTHAETRWGSCSSKRTISLNVWLMEVPEELRDYVIIHELAHLNHMDHSPDFWAEVALHDPKYKIHKKRLKQYNPGM